MDLFETICVFSRLQCSDKAFASLHASSGFGLFLKLKSFLSLVFVKVRRMHDRERERDRWSDRAIIQIKTVWVA